MCRVSCVVCRVRPCVVSCRVVQELSYVDLCVFHVLDGIAFQCPEEWAAAQVPLLKAFHERIASLPAIARYLKSDRRFPFSGTGPIF